jgi:hypothetical protein
MFTGSAAGNQGRESEHGGVHFAFIGGPFAFAGALRFGLQLGECGRRSFGEADQLPWVPIGPSDCFGAGSAVWPSESGAIASVLGHRCAPPQRHDAIDKMGLLANLACTPSVSPVSRSKHRAMWREGSGGVDTGSDDTGPPLHRSSISVKFFTAVHRAAVQPRDDDRPAGVTWHPD